MLFLTGISGWCKKFVSYSTAPAVNPYQNTKQENQSPTVSAVTGATAVEICIFIFLNFIYSYQNDVKEKNVAHRY